VSARDQRWEGAVEEVLGGSFTAQLHDLDDTLPPHSAEIWAAAVDDTDRELIRPGALFFLTVTETGADLRFRRVGDAP
jgi:hypothetical protein